MPFRSPTGKVIKSPKKLSFDYVPNNLPHRDEHQQKLFVMFRRVIESGVSQNAFLHGNVGTGKTASAKRFCMDYEDWAADKGSRVDYIFINCRKRSNKSQILWKIISKFDRGFPDRGFSVGEMMEILRRHIKSTGTHLFIVLDEADALINRDGPELVFLLSRFDDENISPKGSISLFLISQKNVLELLDESALSSFKRSNRVLFNPYDKQQLFDILSYRADLSLYPGSIEEDELNLLSLIASERGDARLGIELMEKAALFAEEDGRDNICAEDIRTAKADVDPYMTTSRLKGLNDNERMILLAAAQKLRGSSFTTTSDLESHYHLLCENHDKTKLGHTQFWKYLKTLSAHGILETETISSGKGRTTKVSLSDIPAVVLEKKLLEYIEG